MSPKSFHVVVLPGDGIGPEVVAEAVKVLEVVSEKSPDFDLKLESHIFGGCAIDTVGEPLPASLWQAMCLLIACRLLRKTLGLYANIRPTNLASESLIDYSPLRPEIARGVDMIVVRELIGGAYFGPRKEQNAEPNVDTAWDTMIYSVAEVQRITRVAAQIALSTNPPLEIHSIDKANVLASSRLWRKVVTETLTNEYPQLKFDHHLVDSAAMVIVSNPTKLNGVIVTENLFGDILSDQSSVIPGSLGLLPSASMAGAPSAPSADFKPTSGLYEPIHGSAPDIAGQGIANPIGTILSAAMLLRYSLGLERPANAIEAAVRKVLDAPALGGHGLRTADLGGKATTKDIGDCVVKVLLGSL